MQGPETIGTHRLWLRLLRPAAVMAYQSAAQALIADGQDRAHMLTFPAPFTEAMARQRINTSLRWWAQNTGWSYGIWQGPQLIGQAQIVIHGHRQRLGEVAYWLSKSARGHGYGTEAVAALMNAAQSHWPLERVEATVVPGNKASIAVLTRLGFTIKGREIVPYDLPHQLPFGLHRFYTRQGHAQLLIFAKSIAHLNHE